MVLHHHGFLQSLCPGMCRAGDKSRRDINFVKLFLLLYYSKILGRSSNA